MKIFMPLLALVVVASYSAAAEAPSTGTIRGEVVVKGSIKRVKVKSSRVRFNPYGYGYGRSSKDKEKAEDRESHLVVYLEGVKWSGKAGKAKRLGQKNKQFSEDVLPVLGGGRVSFANDEKEVWHHIFSKKKPWSFDLKKKGPGEKNTVRFAPPEGDGIGVVPVFCDLHSNMNAHVLVMKNPFYARLDETGGTFVINDVPPGTYTLTGWHSSLKPVDGKITVKAGKTTKATLVMRGEED